MITNTDTKVRVNDDAVDANAASTTTPLDLDQATTIGMSVRAASGTHATHVVTLQLSMDEGVTYEDTNHTITGIGNIHNVTCLTDFVRAKVTTLEGAASTVNISIVGK
jgi:hypothetical protein